MTGAIRDACKNITAMPARYITWPGQSKPVFDYQRCSVRKPRGSITLSKAFLLEFGTFRIPAPLWQTLGQYACWLEPANAAVNSSKGDKLPSASTMLDAQNRIIDWWQHAYVDSPLKEKFLLEAGSSLPKLVEGEPGLEDIYTAMLHQRARLKADQQLVEWSLC